MYIWPSAISPAGHPGIPLLAAAPIAAAAPGAGLPAGLARFLGDRLPGRRIVLPGDPGYDAARKTFNPRFDAVRPWAVVFCVAEQDARICLEGARRYRVAFRVRSGGHSFAGQSSLDDGLVIDVRGLNNLQIDPARLEATAEAGCTLGALRTALAARGLQLPLGGDPVGVGGFVQGGGFGETSRTFGMNSDRVVAARVLLADGRTVHASETVNHDLWWALRGGTGGNFGVLLEVRYALHRAGERNDWSYSWPLRQPADRATAARALATLQDEVLRHAGPEFNASADLRHWAEQDGGPPQTLRLYLWGNFFGGKGDMDRLVAPLARIPGQEAFRQRATAPLPVLRQSRFVSELGAPDWQALVDDFAQHANLHSTLTLSAWGGAIGAYPRENSAFVHRSAAFNMYVTGFWDGAAEEQKMQAYLRRWRGFVAPFWNGGIYQDFADAECPDYRAAYWGDAFPALLAVKRKYDPRGLFRHPQAIAPRAGRQTSPTWPPLVVAWLGRPIEA